MKISILTLFPEMFAGPFNHSIIKIAQQKKLVSIQFIHIRDFGLGTHKIVDDKPYGGGDGMILRVDVLEKALNNTIDKKLTSKEQQIILLDAAGTTFTQQKAVEFSHLKHLILLCGHYEGVDHRITKFVDQKVSIGTYITTGGEIPAMAITDAVTRLVTGVLRKDVTQNESFSFASGNYHLEYPQYTRPQTYKKLSVPSILLSGNHKKIDTWKKEMITKKEL